MDEKRSPAISTIVAVDVENFSYRSCSLCEKPLPTDDPNASCSSCSARNTSNPGSKRLYRLLMSIATAEEVMVVVCFDRAARVLFGCSADELFNFCALYPSAREKAGEMLEGEMCRMTLSKPKNGNAQHLRVVSLAPFRTGFRPVIETLNRLILSPPPPPPTTTTTTTTINQHYN